MATPYPSASFQACRGSLPRPDFDANHGEESSFVVDWRDYENRQAEARDRAKEWSARRGAEIDARRRRKYASSQPPRGREVEVDNDPPPDAPGLFVDETGAVFIRNTIDDEWIETRTGRVSTAEAVAICADFPEETERTAEEICADLRWSGMELPK